jgi:hypothetical protein
MPVGPVTQEHGCIRSISSVLLLSQVTDPLRAATANTIAVRLHRMPRPAGFRC